MIPDSKLEMEIVVLTKEREYGSMGKVEFV